MRIIKFRPMRTIHPLFHLEIGYNIMPIAVESTRSPPPTHPSRSLGVAL